MMPMCACSVCDGCARAALTEADNNNNACPACGEPDNSPEDLIPCRKVREKVNEFKSKSSGAAKVGLHVQGVSSGWGPGFGWIDLYRVTPQVDY